MTQYVTDEAGTRHAFPDEATPEMIAEAMGATAGAGGGQEVHSAPPQMSGPGRYLAGAGEAAIRGLIHTAGLPGDLLPRVDPAMLDYLGLPPGTSSAALPSTNELLDFAGRHGVPVMSANLVPEPGLERIGAEAVSGAAGAAPLVALGAPALGMILAGASGGAAGEAAHEALPNSTAAPIIAGTLAGGLAGLRSGPTIESVAKQLGTSETLEHAGLALEDAATSWRQGGMDHVIDAARAPLDALVPGSAPVVPRELVSRQSDLLARGGQASDAVKDFFTSTAKSGGALGQTATDIQLGLPITWDEAKAFRTELGTNLRNARPAERAAIEHLYGGITADLGSTATMAGAGDEFANFNAVSTAAYKLDAGPVEQILGASQPGAAANRFLVQARQGGQPLAQLRAASPEFSDAVDELAAAHLRTGGAWSKLSPEGQAALVPDPDLRSAASQVAPKAASRSGTHSLQAIAGGTFAHAASIVGSSLLPQGSAVNPLVTGAAGELAGMVAPSLWRGARRLASPALLPPALVGAVAGANPLTVPPVTPGVGQ